LRPAAVAEAGGQKAAPKKDRAAGDGGCMSSPVKTHWTEERLQRLFLRYNRKYWDARLRIYRLRLKDLAPRVGLCEPTRRTIFIDTEAHPNDREIRSTLLYEMAHAAAPNDNPAHGYGFWSQLEMLLRKKAPIFIGFPEAGPGVQVLRVPKRFRRCRKLAKRVQSRRNQELARNYPAPLEVTEEMLLREFGDAALKMAFKPALLAISRENGMLDVGGKPLWRAPFVEKARRAHSRARRDHLQYLKRWKQITRRRPKYR
jgi:hypothetical protein